MKLKKILCAVSAAALVISAMCASFTYAADTKAADTFNDLNQTQITQAMAAGWNLGNQLESALDGTPGETKWGNPVITKGLIQTVKDQGFSTIRIPVSYLSKIGDKASGYKVDEAWLARIKEVVDYAYDIGMYVIVNMHGDGYNTVDGGWLLCNAPESQQADIREKYAAVWGQVAEMFKDYDEHLIFESMNEEFDGSYSTPNKTYYENINKYNQVFIDTVRQTGSNNAKRWLLICGWNTDIDNTVGNYGFRLPTDNYKDASITGNRLMMSVHYYAPWDFAGDGTNTKYSQWGKDADPSKKVSYGCDEDYMETQIKKVYNSFVSKGYPVVIGEYGCINKASADPENTKYRAHYVNTMCTYAKQYGCVPVYWDNGASSNSFGLINRASYKVVFPEIIDAMVSVYSTDEENINRAIAIAKTCVETNYTAETWETFSNELANAEKIVAASDSSKYASAYNSLINAYFNLKEAQRAGNLKPVAKPITEVVYNITSTSDAVLYYQYCDADASGEYPTYEINVSAGTNDYTLVPPMDTTGFWNLGYVMLENTNESMVVNSITINGYTFDNEDLKIGNALTGVDSGNGMLNIWQGVSGTFDSTDKAACVVVDSKKIEFCVYEEDDNPIPTYSITGTIRVSDADESAEMTVTAISEDGKKTSVTAKGMGEYVINNLEAGEYTIEVSGEKYAPHEYYVSIVSKDVNQGVFVNLYGDINGDGKVTTVDVGYANSHAKGVRILYDYQFICADVATDGEVTTADVGKINAHAKNVKNLW